MPQDYPRFTIQFSGTPQGVRRALSQIRSELGTAGASPDQMGRIETVMAEVLNNVVEHALAGQPNGLVETFGQRRQGDWAFQVRDSGQPLPKMRLPGEALPTVNTRREDLPEGGFGWAMVHMLTSDVSYSRQTGRNCLKFSVPDY
ncbi:serine/threonine-protein kinase RsbW [Shimia gijangensis]|uniref:Serine/threonine-protein kinase RsbW n=1 Tax=Shimia gijangensis TaxID=1470563 RepID=A0A1M6B2Z8_9RHOB|nr:ATP-binding protein [Shimia gijangensis]SHI43085.1 serine/threonine-protein kinase RsbW [Shimia gijangensis]